MKITIIGAGPRGLIMLQNLFKNLSQPTEIDLYDPFQIGGKVWQPEQSLVYLMNSTAQLITLFNDLDSDTLTGPTLYQWSKSDAAVQFIEQQNYAHDFIAVCNNLNANDFPPRALFGVYAQWFYQTIMDKKPANFKVNFINQVVTNLKTQAAQFYLTTAKHADVYDYAIISTGNGQNHLTADQKSLADYAQKYDLNYFAPEYVTDTPLNEITADQNVLLRGMGLNFFDYMAAFTLGRGGKFIRDEQQQLKYLPSGKEPQLVAGSRRGVPYFPKATNELPVGKHLPLYFMNWNQINHHLVNGKLPYEKFLELFKAEIENRYYQLLIQLKYPNLDAADFTDQFIKSHDRKATITQFNFQANDLLDWDLLANPVAGVGITTTADYQKILLQWLKLIANDAKLGSLHAPITGALTIFVEMRTTIQKLVADHYFTNEDYVNKFAGDFAPFVGFMTAGPPVERYEELIALMQAGIITIVPPQLQIMGANHHFITRSHFYPQEIFTCDSLIEARLPKADLNLSANPLLVNLKQENIINNYNLSLADDTYVSGAIAVNKDYSPDNDQLFIWGVPLTGLEWMTTALPHALSTDRNFVISNQITNLITKHI